MVTATTVSSERLMPGGWGFIASAPLRITLPDVQPLQSRFVRDVAPRDHVNETIAELPDLDDSPARGKTWYTKTVEHVINVLWAIIVSRAMADQFPIHSGRVFLTTSPERGHNRVILAIFARKASAAQTIAFWNSLEPNFQRWMSTANSAQVKEFLTRVSPHFYWGDTYR